MYKEPEDVLRHFGVRGMHWGTRKARPVAVQRPTTWKQRRVSSGQARIDRAGGTGRAVAFVAGRQLVTILATRVAGNLLISKIPDKTVRTGAAAVAKMLEVGSLAVSINDVTKVAQAHSANKN